jgi:two-component system, response regulator
MTEGVDILIVEDDAADAEMTLRALHRRVANRLDVVRDGEQALSYLRAAAAMPRLILLDLRLPKLGGLRVLDAIRRDTRARQVPVVVLTSSQEEADVARAYELGANSYIVKPVVFDGFVKAVTDAGLYWLLLNQAPSTVR